MDNSMFDERGVVMGRNPVDRLDAAALIDRDIDDEPRLFSSSPPSSL
jgi:hypothetical protein